MENFASILDHHAEQRPDAAALIAGERCVTWRELHDRVGALAAGLAELGVTRGDRVAVLLHNRVEFLETLFAVNRLGAALLPLNYRLAAEEWRYILVHSEAVALVTEPAFLAGAEKAVSELATLSHRLVVDGDAPVGWSGYAALVRSKAGATVPLVDVEPDEMQRLMYTSGTTSRPKGVRLSHRNLAYKNLGMLVQFGWGADEVTAVAGPLYHVGALDMGGLATLHVGGTLVLLPRFDAAELVELIARHRVTSVWLAPAMVNGLLQVPDLENADLSSLKLIMSGGEKMPESRLRCILELFPDLWFADAYGLTETVSSDTFVPRAAMHDKLGSVGRPLAHVRVRVVDEDGADVPAGTTGEIAIRGPKVFAGYWRDPDATAKAIRAGWFHTGDVGRLDEDGFLYIEDRKKDMIVSGGENIASPEVERVLYEHPGVLEAAVVGRPSQRWGEVPHAFVVPRPGVVLDVDEVVGFCRERLARFKVPQTVDLVEELPRTASGKVLKRELRLLVNGPTGVGA